MWQPNLVAVIHRRAKEMTRTFPLRTEIKKWNTIKVDQARGNLPPVAILTDSSYFLSSKDWSRELRQPWPSGGLRSPMGVPEGPRHQVTQLREQYTAMRTSTLTSSLAAWPYSNKHVIQNFLEPPSHLRIVPSYCTKQLCEGGQRAAALFCCGLGIAERRMG